MTDNPSTLPRSILVASDLSGASDRVIRTAAEIALKASAEWHVVCAYAPPSSGFARAGDDQVPESVLAEVREALPAQLRRVLSDDARPASEEVRFGTPVDVILERARETEAELIVLGTHRGTDVHAQFLGTTADAVLRRASVPCLAVRGSLVLPLRRVGVATDLSPVGAVALGLALDWAYGLAPDSGAADPPSAAIRVAHALPSNRREETDSARESLARLVDDAVRRRPEASVELSSEVIVETDAATALARWADRIDADLLVVGTRSRDGRRRGTLGSVSSAVARRAPCPVLLVPPNLSGNP